jgi:AcrR family transcriptional regulator
MNGNDLRQERHRRRKEENRRFILGAAEAVFAIKGYTHSSMDDIAVQAGFSKATLYKYFRSKKEIFLDIITNSLLEVEKQLDYIGSSESSASERLREYIRFVMNYYYSKENLIRIFFLEKQTLLKLFHVDPPAFPLAKAKHPPVPQDIQKGMARISRIMEKIIGDGVHSGEFRQVDVPTASFILGALIRGFHFRGPLRGPGFSLEDSADIILNYFLKGIKNTHRKMENKGD